MKIKLSKSQYRWKDPPVDPWGVLEPKDPYIEKKKKEEEEKKDAMIEDRKDEDKRIREEEMKRRIIEQCKGKNMKKSFNLKKYIKQAFYDDARGYMQTQTRAWQNCYKQQCDKKKQPQDAWNTCMEEYQKAENKGKWTLSYSGAKDEGVKQPMSAKTPAAQKIIKE